MAVPRVINVPTVPATGFMRLPQVLAVIPISRSSWWSGIKSGKYPAGFKISEHCTAWRAEDIHALIARLGVHDR